MFYSHSLPSADSRAVGSFLQNNMHKYWLTTKPAHEKCGEVLTGSSYEIFSPDRQYITFELLNLTHR